MKIEILGSGGATTTPRPGCQCHVCVQARANGVPYSRTGPSVFVHGPNVLIDTPEESKLQLDRAGIGRVEACLYSHWHPDHVMGRRVFEAVNMDFAAWPPNRQLTNVYLPQEVAHNFRERLGSWEHLMFLQKHQLITVHQLEDDEYISLNGVEVYPFRLAEDYVYAFLFEGEGRRVLIAMDELYGWQPPDFVRGVDLVVMPMGLTEFDPFDGHRVIPAEHPVLRAEATYRQTLDMVRTLDAGRVVLSHIEEAVRLSHDDLKRLEDGLHDEGLNVEFAYDTMLIEV
ncbi:MAG: hypothetical protein GYB65_16340 [Chloroflexi bacterium]|nr:hypothetical protein [Chloroflexota bacterium]